MVTVRWLKFEPTTAPKTDTVPISIEKITTKKNYYEQEPTSTSSETAFSTSMSLADAHQTLSATASMTLIGADEVDKRTTSVSALFQVQSSTNKIKVRSACANFVMRLGNN